MRRVQLVFSPRLPEHPDPRPIRRRRVGGDWEYEGDEVAEAALLWGIDFGFDLAAFDDWLEEPDMPADFARQLLGFRQLALDAQQAGNEAAVEPWVLLLRLFLQRRGERQILIPEARLGLQYRRGQADRARLKVRLTEAQRQRMRQQYEHRKRDGQAYGAIKALARAFNVSERTVGAIVRDKRNLRK